MTQPPESPDPLSPPDFAAPAAEQSPQDDAVVTPRRSRRGNGQGRWAPALVAALAAGLIAGVLGGIVGFAAADRTSSSGVDPSISLGSVPTGSSERPSDSIAGVSAKLLPTVVSLSVRGARESDTGSGFVIRPDGYILTNNHVIAAAVGGGSVTVGFNDGSNASATIVGRDVAYDLAVVKVDKTGLPTLPLGNSDEVVVGDTVLAIGSPLGLSGTVTAGIVSALNRPVTAGDQTGSDTSFINAIQTDAAINPGNSGGPLVNSAGAAIGVNSAIASLGSSFGGQSGNIGVGFAIPINQARRTAEEIIKTGSSTRPVIGVTLDVSFTGTGAKIATAPLDGQSPVTTGGPADKAGIKPGDVILSVDGRQINSADEFIVAIRSKQPGDVVTLRVQRGDAVTNIKVTLGSKSSNG